MSSKERIFHVVMFEATALTILIAISALMTDKETSDLALVGFALSMFAVAWNYFYNIGFDLIFGMNRNSRGLMIRIIHATGFEGVLVFITVPTVAWFLQISLLEAIVIEAGLLVFFFFFTIGFNWFYDQYQPYKRWFGPKAAN
ncbi:PACE efflux transporter [Nitrosomonas cryotolerans]|nr:PACE efflux transporter [Nitrosomonas cryotolerans]